MLPQITPPPVAPVKTEERTWRAGTLVYSRWTLGVLFFWLLLGDFSWSMRDRSVGNMAGWYVSSLQVSSFTYAALTAAIPTILSIILGPIVSVMSDRHRGKRGRRIPFLLITTPFAAAGMVGLGLTPIAASLAHSWFPHMDKTMLAIISFAIFWTAFEFATIAGAAVFGGLLNDVVPPDLIGRFYGLFRAISLIDGMIFNYWLMGHTPQYFTIILIGLGVFYGTSFMLVCLKVKEGEYPPPPPRDQEPAMGVKIRGEMAGYFRTCFSHPYYISVFVMITLAALTFLPVNAFSIPYALHLGLDMDRFGKTLALTYFISLVLAYPLGWLADYFHPLRMAFVTLGLYAVTMVWGVLTATSPDSFVKVLLVHGVISGSYLTCAASLGNRLYPKGHFAQLASGAGLMLALVGMLFSLSTGALIDFGGKAYRLTFLLGALVAVGAMITTATVYRQYNRYGGSRDYTPPAPKD